MNNKSGAGKSAGLQRVQSICKASLLICGIVSATVFLAVCIFALAASRGEEVSLFKSSAATVTVGWMDAHANAVTLPSKLTYPSDAVFDLRVILSEEHVNTKSPSIQFSAKYLNATLYLDAEEIGSCICQPQGAAKTAGKTFIIAPLPPDAAGKELRIVAEPLLGDGLEYHINAPMIGEGGRLVYDLIISDLPMLITLEAIFCFGLLLMLFSWQARKTGNSTFFHIGLFAILFAMYSLSITDTIHLFLDNSLFIYLMEFLLLALFPLPLLVLVHHVCLPRFRPVIIANIIALSANFLLQVALYFFTDLELRDTVIITHILLGLSVVGLTTPLALSSRQGQERFRLLVSFSPVLLGAVWDLVRFYLPGTYQKAIGFQLGVLLFIFLQTVDLVRSYLQSDLYRKVAFTDALTGLQNRTAFEERIAQLNKSAASYASVWCICADVNHLKQVNDTLGHSAGDKLICGAASVLSEAMSRDSDLYRTGGDEFVLFAYNQSPESITNSKERLDEVIKRHNRQSDMELSIAVGYDCMGVDDTITKLISRADSIMYEDKHRAKSQCY